MRRSLIIGFLVGLTLAGCGRTEDDTRRIRMPFKAKLAKMETPGSFQVLVVARGAGLSQIRESVRYPATVYCLRQFGTSNILWQTSPATGDWAMSRGRDDRLVFQGKCQTRP